MSEFHNHVEQLHAERDKLFETEYTVSKSTSSALNVYDDILCVEIDSTNVLLTEN